MKKEDSIDQNSQQTPSLKYILDTSKLFSSEDYKVGFTFLS